MLLAELEIFHSRPITPTRRVALGQWCLPMEPAPGAGGVLLAGVVARFLPDVDVDFHDDFLDLLTQLQRGQRIPQPRLRHRLQVDRIGLTRSVHRLERVDGRLRYAFQQKGAPEQYVLAAAYAAGAFPYSERPPIMDLLRRAERWRGPADATLIAHLTGRGDRLGEDFYADPLGWALGTLGFDERPEAHAVQRRFRELLRNAHPDTATGERIDAAQRIADLSEARRILLA